MKFSQKDFFFNNDIDTKKLYMEGIDALNSLKPDLKQKESCPPVSMQSQDASGSF